MTSVGGGNRLRRRVRQADRGGPRGGPRQDRCRLALQPVVHLERGCHPRRHPSLRQRLRDDNPLWCDPDHAATSRWGGIVHTPGFLRGRRADAESDDTAEVKASGRGALSGVHIVLGGLTTSGSSARLREGDRILGAPVLRRRPGKAAVEIRWPIGVCRCAGGCTANDSGNLIAIWDADFVHTEREAAAARNTDANPSNSTSSPMPSSTRSTATTRLESVRGARSVTVEDVTVGEQFTPRFRGPMVTGDVIAWLQGNGRPLDLHVPA